MTDPAAAVIDVDESATEYVLRGTSNPGATVSIATPGRDPYSVSADADGEWSAASSCVGAQRVRGQRHRSGHRQESRRRRSSLSSRCPFLVIEAPTLSVDQPAEARPSRTARSRSRAARTNADLGRGQRGLPRPGRARRAGRAPRPRRRPRPRPVDRAGRARTAPSATPFELTAGPMGDHGHRPRAPRARRTALTRTCQRRLQGRQPRRLDQGRARPGSRSGWTARSTPSSAPPGRSWATARP